MTLQTLNEVMQWNLFPGSMKPKKKNEKCCFLKARETKNECNEIICVQIKDKEIMASFFNLMISLAIYNEESISGSDVKIMPTSIENGKTEENKNPEEKGEVEMNKKTRRAYRFLKEVANDLNIVQERVVKFLKEDGLSDEELRIAYTQAGVSVPEELKTADVEVQTEQLQEKSPKTKSTNGEVKQLINDTVLHISDIALDDLLIPNMDNDLRYQRALAQHALLYSIPKSNHNNNNDNDNENKEKKKEKTRNYNSDSNSNMSNKKRRNKREYH